MAKVDPTDLTFEYDIVFVSELCFLVLIADYKIYESKTKAKTNRDK